MTMPPIRVVASVRMEPRRIKVFFYGLFMDVELLRSKGLQPTAVQAASVPGYELRIAQKASLAQNATCSAHGVAMELSQTEIELLYSDPSVSAYRPEAVLAQLADGSYIPALCFNLVTLPAQGEVANPDYAVKWRALAARLKLPAAYVESVR